MREGARGRAKGGQVIGLRKGSGNFEVKEWDYGLIMKEKRSRIKIITVYNNKKVTKLKESLE